MIFVLSGNLCSSVPFKWRNHHLYLEEEKINWTMSGMSLRRVGA
jgi:hypothetical protein